MTKKYGRAEKLAARKRMLRCADLYIQGMTNHRQLAAALGVSTVTVIDYIKKMEREWVRQDIRKVNRMIAIQVRRNEWGAYQAVLAFARSQQNEETIRTEYLRRKCPMCKEGMVGENEDQWCPNCQGTGEVLIENVTRSVKGQAGDPAYLNTYREFVKEISRLKALYPEKGQKLVVDQRKVIIQQRGMDLRNVPAEKILEARRILLELAGGSSGNGNGKVVDVDSVDSKEKEDGK